MNRATKNDSWVRNPDGTLGFTCSIITGCRLGHEWCFARKLANGRLKNLYLANDNCLDVEVAGVDADPFYPRFWMDRLVGLDHFLAKRKKPVGVFLNIMGEWAGDWVPEAWQNWMFEIMRRYPQHRFYILTHCPKNLPKWSPFPDNCYVGVTLTTREQHFELFLNGFRQVGAKIKYVSLEPLLEPLYFHPSDIKTLGINWLIIGAMTGAKKDIMELHQSYPKLTPMPWGKRWTLQPLVEWVGEVAGACGRAGVPLFLKENLQPMVGELAKIGLAKPKKVRVKLDDTIMTCDVGGSGWGLEGDFAVDQGGKRRLKIEEVLAWELRQELPNG